MNLPDLTHVHEFAFDFETYDPELTDKGPGFVYQNAKVIGIAIHLDSGFNQYFPLRHKTGNIDYNQLKPWLVELFSSPLRTSIAANYRYDAECLWSMNISNKTWMVDIQIIEALLDEEQMSYSLASIAKRYKLPEKQKDTIEQALRKAGYMKKTKPDWSALWKLPVSLVGEYAEHDARLTYEIYQLQKPLIEKDELQQVVELESKLIPVLHDMRIRGVRVDIDKAQQENERLSNENTELLQAITRDAPNLNPFSSTQLGALVRDYGYIPPITDKGNDSIPNEYLLASPDERLQLIGKYRQQEKIRRDFIEGMILEGSHNGRLHPQIFQTRGSSFLSGDDTGGTRSGRLASSNPNIQQLPSRHPILGPLVRSLFLPDENEQWCSNDYSAQEPRWTAHYAYMAGIESAKELRALYLTDPMIDMHTRNMNLINSIREKPVTRTQAKTINLSLTYGAGVKKISEALEMSSGQAKELIEAYHKAVPWLKELMNKAIQRADTQSYVKSILGRRRRFNMFEPTYFERGKFPVKGKEEAMAKYGNVRKSGLHKALNSVIQSTSAEQTKSAMIALYEEGFKIILSVHDEIAVSLPSKGDAKRIKEIMETILPCEIPHIVDQHIGENWSCK